MRASLSRRWQSWVALWDHHESPKVLGCIRLFVGVTLLYDFLYISHLDLVEALFAPNTLGGMSNVMDRPELPLIFRLFPASVATAQWMHGLICLSAFLFTIGFFTRTSGIVLLLLYAQSALIVPLGDRGIDLMMRNVLLIIDRRMPRKVLHLPRVASYEFEYRQCG